MIIGIIGTRRRNTINDKSLIEKELIKLINEFGKDNITICSGGCEKGGDKFGEELGLSYNLPMIIYKPDWKKYGKIAGFLRNTLIASDSDILIACVSEDRTGGTEDTIKKFNKIHPNSEPILV